MGFSSKIVFPQLNSVFYQAAISLFVLYNSWIRGILEHQVKTQVSSIFIKNLSRNLPDRIFSRRIVFFNIKKAFCCWFSFLLIRLLSQYLFFMLLGLEMRQGIVRIVCFFQFLLKIQQGNFFIDVCVCGIRSPAKIDKSCDFSKT